jgi:hypothetical protein
MTDLGSAVAPCERSTSAAFAGGGVIGALGGLIGLGGAEFRLPLLVVYDEPTYDEGLGLPGLHQVRTRVEYHERESCLPPDVAAKYANVNFWLNPNLNTRNVTVL